MSKPLNQQQPGKARLFRSLAQAVLPPPDISVAEWAAQNRMVSDESGSPHAGPWKNERTPYLTEIMECLSAKHPCRSVTFVKSHQVGGTEVGLNLIGSTIDLNPSVVLVVMASLDEASKFATVKLQPTIDATPSLSHRVRDLRSRSEQGSTTKLKKFSGGYLQLTGANSAKGLKMISVKILICDEISDWPEDVDKQGDPLSMAEKRTTAHSHSCKKFFVSTPSLKGACRVTEKYEASDMRRYYVPCSQCGAFQVLTWDQMKWASPRAPHGAYMACKSCDYPIEHFEKKGMVASGRWIKSYDDADAENPAPPDVIPADRIDGWHQRSSAGREPGFHIWQAYSLFVDWDDTVAAFVDAEGKSAKEKDFVQQVEGLAYEEPSDAPDIEKLLETREEFPFKQVPPEGLVLTGFVDVQGNRLEYGVYAWGPGLSGWHIDGGILEGDPEEDGVWRELDNVMARSYQSPNGHTFVAEAWGVDSGYLSSTVYNYARSRPLVHACDGQDGWTTPMVGTPTRVDINFRGKKIKGGAMLHPLGTFALKRFVMAGLRKWIAGSSDGAFKAGTLHYSTECDKEHFEQLTAEVVADKQDNRGFIRKVWKKRKNRPNEQLDIAVGARAMAYMLGLDFMSDEDWRRVAKERGAPDLYMGDLFNAGHAREEGTDEKPSGLARLAARNRKH